MTIFIKGDQASYVGCAMGTSGHVLIRGDEVTVITGNLDEDDDVIVDFDGAPVSVRSEDLVWLAGA